MRSPEVTSFAESIRAIVTDHATPSTWAPGACGDDLSPELSRHLENAGWNELGQDEDTLAFAGAAGAELGRGLVALREIDRLLGGSPYVSGMTRYAETGAPAFVPTHDGILAARIVSAEAVPYGDHIGACRAIVDDGTVLDPGDAQRRERTWVAGTIGYLGGLVTAALGIALDHIRTRQAFGATLASLESVQQRVADAALCADGLLLLAEDAHGLDALAYAGPASCAALAECHQVVGAIGYTLEFPLQRFSRRARSIQLWADSWIAARS